MQYAISLCGDFMIISFQKPILKQKKLAHIHHGITQMVGFCMEAILAKLSYINIPVAPIGTIWSVNNTLYMHVHN